MSIWEYIKILGSRAGPSSIDAFIEAPASDGNNYLEKLEAAERKIRDDWKEKDR